MACRGWTPGEFSVRQMKRQLFQTLGGWHQSHSQDTKIPWIYKWKVTCGLLKFWTSNPKTHSQWMSLFSMEKRLRNFTVPDVRYEPKSRFKKEAWQPFSYLLLSIYLVILSWQFRLLPCAPKKIQVVGTIPSRDQFSCYCCLLPPNGNIINIINTII